MDAGPGGPWVVLTDKAPDDVDLGAYGLRVWIEQGFRTLKRMGWQWHRTRRQDPDRVARHWLVLAYGMRVEEARHRPLSVFQLSRSRTQRLLHRGYSWARVWLQPLPGPDPPGELAWVDPPAG